MRHVPVWFDRFPKARRPAYGRFRGEYETQVAIVGGGLAAAACVHTLAVAGIPAIVLAEGPVGGGITGGSAGVIREGFAGPVHDTVARYGLRTSRALWDGVRRAGLDFAAAIRRHEVRCDLVPLDLLTVTGRAAEHARRLRREYATRHDAGIEGSWVAPTAVTREAALESGGAIRTHGFGIDPYRACVGLFRQAEERGAAIHEGSPVRRIRSTKGGVTVATERGSVRAESVIVTGGAAAIQDLRPLRRHLRDERVYGVQTEPVPAVVRRSMGKREAALESVPGDHRYIRWMPDDSVLIVGARGPELAERARKRTLIQRTGQMMYEFLLLYPEIAGLQPAAAWDVADDETVDGLPFIGPHRNFPRHFFAFGSNRHGEGLAWLAARMALRYLQGEPARGDEAFGFQRIL